MNGNEKYLVVNAGSSSLKFSLYSMPEEEELINGYVEKIGLPDCFWTLKIGENKIKHEGFLKNHGEAVAIMMKELMENQIISGVEEIKGVGHRVLHGGEYYSESTIIDEEVLNRIIELTKLGPLHHPGEISGIVAMQEYMPEVPQIAVFDTAFHQTMPKANYTYPVPYEWYEKYGVRKYGFHGTSHKYITSVMKSQLNKEDVNLIVCHIGSGASISAIKDGKCYDTTMGLTPLDGLMMGTRSGSVDPSLLEYISKCTGKTLEEITNALNKESGLLGIAGKSDFRDIESLMQNGDEKAKLAFEMFRNSIVKYIAQYYFELEGQVDAIVFTAGIGENAMNLRQSIIEKISHPLHIALDTEQNNNIAKFKSLKQGIITTPESSIPVYVLPTNEEYMILKDTFELSQHVKEKGNSRVLKP